MTPDQIAEIRNDAEFARTRWGPQADIGLSAVQVLALLDELIALHRNQQHLRQLYAILCDSTEHDHHHEASREKPCGLCGLAADVDPSDERLDWSKPLPIEGSE